MQHYYKRLFQGSLKNIIRGEKIISKDIRGKTFEEQLLWLSTKRFVSHAKAVIILCNKRQNLEALMLLRPIIELVVNLRWIVEDSTGNNREQFMRSTEYQFDNNGIPKMGGYWTNDKLWDRMRDIGFDKNYYNTVVKKIHEELHVNPTVIARAYDKNLTSMDSESIFSIAFQFTGHLLKAANAIYGDKYFMKHNDIFEKIK